MVRGEDPNESADRITTLLADPELRRRMGERGRAWVEEKWRWDLLAEHLRTLLQGGSAARARQATDNVGPPTNRTRHPGRRPYLE